MGMAFIWAGVAIVGILSEDISVRERVVVSLVGLACIAIGMAGLLAAIAVTAQA